VTKKQTRNQKSITLKTMQYQQDIVTHICSLCEWS